MDAGYATRPGFIAPYRKVRYHLSDFSTENPPTNAKELFNLRHSSLRTTVERVFGSLKSRFKILDSKPFHPFVTQVDIVNACCILHNFIIDKGGDRFMDDICPSDAATSDPWIPMDLSGNNDRSEQREEWIAKRESICNEMWERHLATLNGMAE